MQTAIDGRNAAKHVPAGDKHVDLFWGLPWSGGWRMLSAPFPASLLCYRAQTPGRRLIRRFFVEELLRDFTVYPYMKETATLAGKVDGEQQAKAYTPFADLLIEATALSLGFSVLTVNLRRFRLIPGLAVVPF